jgi:hypothetical protein
MKPRNSKEIVNKYLIFLGYFSTLLLFTILCALFYLKTNDSYAATIGQKKAEVDFFQKKNAMLAARVDSINTFMGMLNTKMVNNEAALEREIMKLKNETLNDIEALEKQGNDDFFLYKKMLLDVDKILSAKKEFQQVKEEEETLKKKLMECNKATSDLVKR